LNTLNKKKKERKEGRKGGRKKKLQIVMCVRKREG